MTSKLFIFSVRVVYISAVYLGFVNINARSARQLHSPSAKNDR